MHAEASPNARGPGLVEVGRAAVVGLSRPGKVDSPSSPQARGEAACARRIPLADTVCGGMCEGPSPASSLDTRSLGRGPGEAKEQCRNPILAARGPNSQLTLSARRTDRARKKSTC